jgi:hypothetical protein
MLRRTIAKGRKEDYIIRMGVIPAQAGIWWQIVTPDSFQGL